MKRNIVVWLSGAVVLCGAWGTAEAISFRRSFRNGYPKEWNVSKDEATESFRVSDKGVHFSDGRGGIVQTRTASEFFGRVVEVRTGGVLVVRDGRGANRRIRLKGIDVPADAVGQHRVAQFIGGKNVTVVVFGRDRSGCLLANVTMGGGFEETIDVNLTLVREGCARRAKSNIDPRYGTAQKEARDARRGLWATMP